MSEVKQLPIFDDEYTAMFHEFREACDKWVIDVMTGRIKLPMDFNDYGNTAWSTAIYPDKGLGTFQSISYCMLGLAGETGEISEKVKKVYRDKGGVFDQETKVAIEKEIGDVLWYLNALALEIGTTLDSAARLNNEKLLDRMNRGVLKGSGDNR